MIKKINDVSAGTKRPLRISDLQDIWDGLTVSLANGTDVEPRIISGFDVKPDGKLSKGVVAFKGALYYHDETEVIQLGSNVYTSIQETDERVFDDGSVHPFYFLYKVSPVQTTGSTLIGMFSSSNIDKWRLGNVSNGSITYEKLDEILNKKLKRLYEPKQITTFVEIPTFDDQPLFGSIIPFYADGDAIGSPYPDKNVSGYIHVGNDVSINDTNYVFVVLSVGDVSGSVPVSYGESDILATRKIRIDGVVSKWNYVRDSNLKRIFSGNITSISGDDGVHIDVTGKGLSNIDGDVYTFLIIGNVISGNGADVNSSFSIVVKSSSAGYTAAQGFPVSYENERWTIKYVGLGTDASGNTLYLMLHFSYNGTKYDLRLNVTDVYLLNA